MTRDDWRSLSGLLERYRNMWVAGEHTVEPELRAMLTTWLRDHDMPQGAIEGENVHLMLEPRPRFEFDGESGLCEEATLHWARLAGAFSMAPAAVRISLRFLGGIEPRIVSEVT